ncbi:50S ribosomal protein L10 [Bacteriovoracales bacterium]|nr:50S ribosomal protein L10 [Bacteriovoracales bacterium]
MLTRSKKDELVSGLKGDIDKANAVFLTNLIGIQSNDAVAIRKKVRDVGGKVVVTRNTLFEIAGKDTKCSGLLTNLKGPTAVAFAFDDAAAVAKALKESGKSLEEVSLKGGVLGDKVLSVEEVNELADLPSRDEMLGTLLATFMAPVSALARVLHSVGEKKGESGIEEKAE